MQIAYTSLYTDNFGIEFKKLSGNECNFLVQQGPIQYKRRVQKAFSFASFILPYLKDNTLRPISCNEDRNKGTITALYEYKDILISSTFLEKATDIYQYVVGKRLGRVLFELHQIPLNDKDQNKVLQHRKKQLDKVSAYLDSSQRRFVTDGCFLDALGARFENLKPYKNAIIMGRLSLSNIFLTKDLDIILRPTYNYTYGDIAEDFAVLTFECIEDYPFFIAGALDGYFGVRIPPVFYVNYATYSAMLSLNLAALNVQKGRVKADAGNSTVTANKATAQGSNAIQDQDTASSLHKAKARVQAQRSQVASSASLRTKDSIGANYFANKKQETQDKNFALANNDSFMQDIVGFKVSELLVDDSIKLDQDPQANTKGEHSQSVSQGKLNPNSLPQVQALTTSSQDIMLMQKRAYARENERISFIAREFNNFAKPIPNFMQQKRLTQIRAYVRAEGL